MRLNILILDYNAEEEEKTDTIEVWTNHHADYTPNVMIAQKMLQNNNYNVLIVDPVGQHEPEGVNNNEIANLIKNTSRGISIIIASKEPMNHLRKCFNLRNQQHYDYYIIKPYKVKEDLVEILNKIENHK